MAQIGKKRERRRYSRSPIGKIVPVLWEDEAGRELLMQGQLIDVSVSGAKILVPMRLPARSSVSFNCLTLAVGGRGTVRYCNHVKGGYEIGLELSNGTGWRDQNKDLQNLAAAVDRANQAAQGSDSPKTSLPKTSFDVAPKNR
jgi:PilZ domain